MGVAQNIGGAVMGSTITRGPALVVEASGGAYA